MSQSTVELPGAHGASALILQWWQPVSGHTSLGETTEEWAYVDPPQPPRRRAALVAAGNEKRAHTVAGGGDGYGTQAPRQPARARVVPSHFPPLTHRDGLRLQLYLTDARSTTRPRSTEAPIRRSAIGSNTRRGLISELSDTPSTFYPDVPSSKVRSCRGEASAPCQSASRPPRGRTNPLGPPREIS